MILKKLTTNDIDILISVSKIVFRDVVRSSKKITNRHYTIQYKTLHIINSHLSPEILNILGFIIKEIFTVKKLEKLVLGDSKSVILFGDIKGRTTILKKKNYGDSEVIVLSSILKLDQTVTYLDLKNNKISNAGANSIAELLNVNSVLTSIDLRNNPDIGEEGAKKLADVLVRKTTIKKFNEIPIMKIKENKNTFTELDLRKKDFSNTEAIVLGRMLKSNKTLSSVDIRDNPEIGTFGAKTLSETIIKSTSIETFGEIPVLELKKQYTMNELIFPDCHIGDSELQVLIFIIKGQFIKYSNPNAVGVRLRKSATLPGKTTSAIVYTGDVVPYDQTQRFKHKGHSIKFYRLLDGSGWLHNFNSKDPSASNATVELLPKFKKLDLSKNCISDLGAEILAELLKSNSVLTSLNIANNSRIGIAGAKSLVDAVLKNTSIQIFSSIPVSKLKKNDQKEMDLSNKGYGVSEALVLASLLKINTSLLSLNFNNNHCVGKAGAEALAAEIVNSHIIQTFSDIPVSKMKQNDSKLLEIDLSYRSASDTEAIVLATLLKTNSTVRELDLNGNKISSFGLNALADALKGNIIVKKININGDILLEQLRNLEKSIDLSSKGYKNPDLIIIIDFLEEMSNLTEIIITDNNIGDDGAVTLASRLENNSTVIKLDMSWNEIKDTGAQAIGKLLKVNSSLIFLRLDGNSMTNTGVKSFAEALKINTNLKFFSMYSLTNSIGDAGIQAFGDAFANNTTLSKFFLFSTNNYSHPRSPKKFLRNMNLSALNGEQSKHIMKMFDKDGNNLDKEEIELIILKYIQANNIDRKSRDIFQEFLNTYDLDGDGIITLEEMQEVAKTLAKSLYNACKKNDINLIRILTRGESDIDASQDNHTPLTLATFSGHTEAVNELIKSKVNLNKVNKNGYFPLLFACKKNNDNILEILIKNKAFINKATKKGETALSLACKEGHINILKKLIHANADINSNLLYISCNKGHIKLVQELIRFKANINAKTSEGYAPIHTASGEGKIKILKELIHMKADINKADKNGDTAMHWACKKEFDGVIAQLYEANADLNRANNKGDTPLHISRNKGHDKLVQELIRFKANINA